MYTRGSCVDTPTQRKVTSQSLNTSASTDMLLSSLIKYPTIQDPDLLMNNRTRLYRQE
jgi:hypothetical protein